MEHTIGILKGCWASLRGLRTQYRKKEDLKVINCHIMATVVLHNILNKFNDKWPVKLEDNTHASNKVKSDTEVLNCEALQSAIKQFILAF